MTKNLNQALRKFNYNTNPIEQEIDLLETFFKNNSQINFSTFGLEQMIASELCYEKFKYRNPQDAVKEINQDVFVNMLKDAKIVSRSYTKPIHYSYSYSEDFDVFDPFNYLNEIKNKFNAHVHREIIKKDFSNLLVIQKLYKNYLKARNYYIKINPNKTIIDEPILIDFAETIKNSSFFNLNKEVFFDS